MDELQNQPTPTTDIHRSTGFQAQVIGTASLVNALTSVGEDADAGEDVPDWKERLSTQLRLSENLWPIPISSTSLNSEQLELFYKKGGFAIDISELSEEERKGFEASHSDAPIDWQIDMSKISVGIDGINYSGFGLFQKIYEKSNRLKDITEEEARRFGLYPIIHYRNKKAIELTFEIFGLQYSYYVIKDLSDEIAAGEVPTDLEALGLHPFGYYDSEKGKVLYLGTIYEIMTPKGDRAHRLEIGTGAYIRDEKNFHRDGIGDTIGVFGRIEKIYVSDVLGIT